VVEEVYKLDSLVSEEERRFCPCRLAHMRQTFDIWKRKRDEVAAGSVELIHIDRCRSRE
jgi:hypothetical protein